MAPRPRLSPLLDSTVSPVELAGRCRDARDLVFFDTALEGRAEQEISIIAGEPSEVFRGTTEAEWDQFRRAVQASSRDIGCDGGLPRALFAGAASYDGSFRFARYDDPLIFRHADETWHAPGEHGGATLLDRSCPGMPGRNCERPQFAASVSREHYCHMVACAQEYIAAGDIYQVNLAHRLRAPWSGDPFLFYEALRHYSPAPYAAYLRLGTRSILSSSPELFLRLSGRTIRTRPIKGTRPRRAEQHADEKSAYDLLTSPKEIAELVMITDLERNDLGTVCEYGSVAATDLLKLERYEQVFHLVSTVEGRLREGIDHVTALRACFPGGSITGAPKKRAREIIAELEPEPRGLYTGAIGWFGTNGESQFNIAIRTVIAEPGELHFHVGAGIVADSLPEKEWQETMDKAAGILLAAERMEAVAVRR